MNHKNIDLTKGCLTIHGIRISGLKKNDFEKISCTKDKTMIDKDIWEKNKKILAKCLCDEIKKIVKREKLTYENVADRAGLIEKQVEKLDILGDSDIMSLNTSLWIASTIGVKIDRIVFERNYS